MLAHRRTPTRVARNPRGRAGGCAPSSETAAAGGAAATKPGSLSGRGPTYVARRATFRSNRAPTHANPRRSRQALSARGSARHRRRQKSRLYQAEGWVLSPQAPEKGFQPCLRSTLHEPSAPRRSRSQTTRPPRRAPRRRDRRLPPRPCAPPPIGAPSPRPTAPRSPPPFAALRPASESGHPHLAPRRRDRRPLSGSCVARRGGRGRRRGREARAARRATSTSCGRAADPSRSRRGSLRALRGAAGGRWRPFVRASR